MYKRKVHYKYKDYGDGLICGTSPKDSITTAKMGDVSCGTCIRILKSQAKFWKYQVKRGLLLQSLYLRVYGGLEKNKNKEK